MSSASLFPRLLSLGTGLALLSGCALSRPAPEDNVVGAGTLLREARAETRVCGLPAARELVTQRLAETDESGGDLERRVIRTTARPDLVLPDSFAALTPSQRQRVAIVIVPGTRTGFGGPSMTRQTLREAARRANEMGFATHFVDTPPRGGVPENAELVARWIAPIYDQADHVVLVMLSKGAHDVVHYLQEHARHLPAAHRRKLKLVLSLAGTLQGSVVADHFANAPRLSAVSTRIFLRLQGNGDQIGMLRTVARTPWTLEAASQIDDAFPRVTWISLAMIPDGEDGEIAERLWSPFVRRRIARTSPYYSPADGLVESAAAILPDEVTVPEWVVRAHGSHSMPNGRYLDGSRVAPATTEEGDETLRPVSGGEVMSAYLRALPQSLLRRGG